MILNMNRIIIIWNNLKLVLSSENNRIKYDNIKSKIALKENCENYDKNSLERTTYFI